MKGVVMAKIGLDFDNTIVRYDSALPLMVKDMFGIEDTTIKSKKHVKEMLINKFGENSWIRFQGALYGPGMQYAEPYDNAIPAIVELKKKHEVFIVSHRTKFPYLGEKFNLQKYAQLWAEKNLVFESKQLFLSNKIFFCDSIELKIKKIRELGCDFFLDDLIKIFQHDFFPSHIKKILFSPYQVPQIDKDIEYVMSWKEILSKVDKNLD